MSSKKKKMPTCKHGLRQILHCDKCKEELKALIMSNIKGEQ